jgi:hypothetical protein
MNFRIFSQINLVINRFVFYKVSADRYEKMFYFFAENLPAGKGRGGKAFLTEIRRGLKMLLLRRTGAHF